MKWILLIVPAMALVNAIRGGHFGGDLLPGHPRYWMTAAVFALAFAVMSPLQAALFAAGFLLWCLPPWGHLIGLGRHQPDRDLSAFEAALLQASRGNPYAALWLRHWLVLLMVLAVSPNQWSVALSALLAALIVLAYEAGWRLTPKAPLRTAELITGALLGALLLGGCAIDVNAYHAKGGSTGPIHCKGACP